MNGDDLEFHHQTVLIEQGNLQREVLNNGQDSAERMNTIEELNSRPPSRVSGLRSHNEDEVEENQSASFSHKDLLNQLEKIQEL